MRRRSPAHRGSAASWSGCRRACHDPARQPAARTSHRDPDSCHRRRHRPSPRRSRSVSRRCRTNRCPLDDVLQLLVAVLLVERDTLQRPQLRPDADRTQVIVRCLGQVRVRAVAIVEAGIEAIGVSGLREKLLRLCGIVHRLRRLPEEFEIVRNQAAVDMRKAQRQRLIDRLVDRAPDARPAARARRARATSHPTVPGSTARTATG